MRVFGVSKGHLCGSLGCPKDTYEGRRAPASRRSRRWWQVRDTRELRRCLAANASLRKRRGMERGCPYPLMQRRDWRDSDHVIG